MSAAPAPRPRWTANLAAAIFFTILVWISHGRSLEYGLFLDDLAHYRQLQEADWSLRGLVDACRLELIGGAVELWWLPETTLRFFRPVSFGLMKLTYTLTDWSPRAGHAASLIWHVLVCWLVWKLLARSTGRAGMSAAVAAIFALHPAHVGTVQWIAAQTELIVTAFLLLSILALDRLRGWTAAPSTRVKTLTAVVLISYVLALGCRENAILLPMVALAVDWLYRRSTLRKAIWLYVAMFVIGALYLYLRSTLLGGMQLPPRPYVVPPDAPDFVPYVFNKLCYYLLGEFMAVPCVPIGGLTYLLQYPLAFYGATAGLAGILIWQARQQQGRPLFALGMFALLGFVAPVLPVFESPHHLYLPGVGAILVFGAIVMPPKAAGVWRRRCTSAFVLLALLGFSVLTHYSSLAMETGGQVEDVLIEEMAASPDRIADGDTLYIANLPLIAHYARLGVENATGRRGLRVVALTWAPGILGVPGGAELTWIDDRTIETRVAPERYFSGPIGQLIAQAQQQSLAEMLAEPVETDDFVVRLVEADEDGVAALRFRFHEPIQRPGVHFFWGSRTRWAAPVAAFVSGADGE